MDRADFQPLADELVGLDLEARRTRLKQILPQVRDPQHPRDCTHCHLLVTGFMGYLYGRLVEAGVVERDKRTG